MSRKRSCCCPLWPVRSSILQGDVHRVVLSCARCTGLLRRRCAAVCCCLPCPPASIPCSSVSHIVGSHQSRCRNVNFLPGLCGECCPDVCPIPGARASLLRRRVLPFVLGGLCCLFASATRVRSGPDVRSLFCFQTNVRHAVLITAQCPGPLLRPCAAVCCRSPYPLPASSPSSFSGASFWTSTH